MPERLIGETLGRYRVEALVGSGGFAWVYRAFDPELEIPVALKVLKPQYGADPEFEARFRREASTAAKLRHPNIIKIFAVGKENGTVYFAMDYLPRGLADRLAALPVLPEPTVVRAGLDVAKALAFAHREGVVHRDIKVDNILFDDHGNAVVADFGIARAVAEQVRHTATNMVVGTPQYFSPEQARGLDIDGRSDVYSLGVTLYRAAVGRLPFDGEDWYSIARQHVEEPPPPPRSLNPALSPDLDGILLRCLAKKPEQRFASADELAERLEALRHPTTEITAARTLVMEPFPGPVGRRRRVLFASVGAAAVLAAGAAALYARNAAEDLPAPAVPPAVVDSGRVLALDTVTVVAQPLVDSAVVDSALRAATVEPPKLGLAVSAPAGSEIWVNGQVVARGGSWTSDTLSAGSYTVVALLPLAADGCPSAREQQRVRLAATTRRRLVRSVSLAPRPCGTVEIRARTPEQVTATYEVSDGSTARPLTGQLPLARPLTLPVGSWRLVVKARQCAEYTEDFQVNEQSTKRIFAPMFCGKE